MDWKIGILCAGDRELEPFLGCIQNASVVEKAMLRVHEGTVEGIPAAVLYSGVCKVNAAIAAQLLIDSFGVNAVINAGTAGGLDGKVGVFDTVICTQAAYHDVADDILTEFHPWMPSIYFNADAALLELSRKAVERGGYRHKVHFGKMVTGERFIEDSMRVDILAKYAPLSVDMETASVAHVCYVNGVPFIAVRTVTDTAEHSGLEIFEEHCDKAAGIARDVVIDIIKEMTST
jgi:5''-methylthioadenosine/S-adenosylhomocysteine nucleosidase